MTDTGEDLPRHPMAVVAQRTGLTSHAIRAWERRYDVVAPTRTPGGHRLYSDREVERLELLHRLTLGGRQIGQLATFTDDQLAELFREDQLAEAAAPQTDPMLPGEQNAVFVEQAFQAARELDSESLTVILRRAVIELGPSVYLNDLMVPLLYKIGSAWTNHEVTAAHEHLACDVIKSVGSWLLKNLETAEDAPTIVVATPAGQRHELGALGSAITAAAAGWNICYLGADLPASDIARAVYETKARALTLSLVFPEDDTTIITELRTLRDAVSTSVLIIVGGAGAPSYTDAIDAIGGIRVDSFDHLREHLLQQQD